VPREVVVEKGKVKARVVKFDDDITDDIEDVRVTAKKTEEELEWLRFQWRWAKWKKQFNFSPPDPSNLRCQIYG
jgi:hypothetical protein